MTFKKNKSQLNITLDTATLFKFKLIAMAFHKDHTDTLSQIIQETFERLELGNKTLEDVLKNSQEMTDLLGM